MRPIVHCDLMHAARAIFFVEERERLNFLQRLLREADWADRFRKRIGRAHPKWGNGTLSAVCAQYLQSTEPGLDDAEYRRCLILVLQNLT